MTQNGKVIILGVKHGGLAIARTLGKHGIYTIGVTDDDSDFGLASKYLAETAICPHPKNTRALADFLIAHQADWDGALILETSDYFMRALSEHKAELTQHYKLITPDPNLAKIFIEKDKTYALADEANVPHPKLFTPQTLAELEQLRSDMTLPVMIKPIISHEFQNIFGEKLFICDTFDELQTQFQKALKENQPVVISEIIPGTDFGTLERVQLYVNSKGDFAGEFFHIKLRQTPPMYGVMRVGKSTPVNQDVVKLTRRLLKQADYHGYASVEFKRDYRDNQLKLMEVNIRQPRSSQLAIASGINFPWLIYQDMILDQQVRVESYHENTYLIELLADVVDYVRADPSKHIGKFLQPYMRGKRTFSVFSPSDISPFWKQFQYKFRKLENAFSG